MRIVKRSSTAKHSNSPSCTVYEYDFDDAEVNFCTTEISGRYPDVGFAMNTKCKEYAYIVSGSGTVFAKSGSSVEFAVGDMVLIEPNEPYYWEADCVALLPCLPAWSPDQYEEVT